MSQNFIGSEDFKVRNGLIVGNNFLVVNATSGTLSVNASNSSVSLYLNSTDGIQLPCGNSGQRIFSSPGMLRYNSQLNTCEYYGNANWNPLGNQPFNCGRLQILQPPGNGVVANNLISFIPYNGNFIKVNGQVYQIPSQGIVANSLSCFVNGVGSSNFGNSSVSIGGANTTYWDNVGTQHNANNLFYVYAFNNNGTPALDFCSTGHATSTTAGNVGTEIKAGDDTRTLVGMVWPVPLSASSTQLGFNDSLFDTVSGCRYQRNLANWFNRQRICIRDTKNPGGLANDNSWHPWGDTLYGLLWGDELTIGIHTWFWTYTSVTEFAAIIMPDINAYYLRHGSNLFIDPLTQFEDSAGYICVQASAHYTDFTGTYMKEGLNGFNSFYTTSSTGGPGSVFELNVSYRA